MSDFQTLSFTVDNAIARVILNRPTAANGISLLMAEELAKAAIICEQTANIRAVLIAANGAMFSAGGDVKGFAAAGDNASIEIRQLMVSLHAAVAIFTRLPVPVVISVNGMAAGAGFSLACGGDIVIAAESAQFTMAYTAIGLSPDAGATWHLPRLIGLRRTQELMLTNRRLTATEACEWGIVTRVVSDDQLAEETEKVIQQLANGPTKAYAAVKRLLNSSSTNTLDAQLELEAQSMASLVKSEDGWNAIQSFVQKLKPSFTGR